ncbi:MAG: hypothetical protein FJ290_10970 [Planctomycetes bacterium]|nr:hypothetical protein [Planctomycetota bacterium]
MRNNQTSSRDPDMIASLPAMRRAARRALQLGLETGTPVWVMKNGRIVDLTKLRPRRKKARLKADS